MSVKQEGYSKLAVQQAIDIYDRLYPTGPDSSAWSILSYRNELRELELQGVANRRTGVINKSDAGRRMKMVMPSNLYTVLLKKFPTIFKADMKKFERDFPVFFRGWKT